MRDRFARALQEAMAVRKVSGRELARRLEMDPRRISGWLKGRNLPDLYEAPLLASELRVDEDLFRNPPEVPPPPPKPYYPIDRYLLPPVVADGLEEGARRLRNRARSGAGRPARRPGRRLREGEAGHG